MKNEAKKIVEEVGEVSEKAGDARRVSLGKVGVDSGMLLISDPAYNAIGNDQAYTYDEFLEMVGNSNNKSLPYKMGHEGRGVVVGVGDWTYPVEGVLDEEGRLVEIVVKLR